MKNPSVGVVGQTARYVGWKLNPRPTGKHDRYIPMTEPDSVPDDNSPKVRALINEVRRDKCLRPADQYTAERCGLSFTPSTTAPKKSAPKAE
jgi:hypothetical protein